MKKLKLLKNELRRFIDSFGSVSGYRYYSQLAEDAILANFFFRVKRKSSSSLISKIFRREQITKGYFIDIGAYSPKLYSNTYYFYKSGWNGITVEPNKKAKKWFRFVRPREKYICAAIGNSEGEKMYYHSAGYSGENFISTMPTIQRVGYIPEEIRLITLSELFQIEVPVKQHVDLLSIDCEGYDFSVLKSNDWSKFRPSVVVVETDPYSEITEYMKENDYEILAFTIGSVIYKDTYNTKLSW